MYILSVLIGGAMRGGYHKLIEECMNYNKLRKIIVNLI